MTDPAAFLALKTLDSQLLFCSLRNGGKLYFLFARKICGVPRGVKHRNLSFQCFFRLTLPWVIVAFPLWLIGLFMCLDSFGTSTLLEKAARIKSIISELKFGDKSVVDELI